MNISASEVIEFTDKNRQIIKKFCLISNAAAQLRSATRAISTSLYEDEPETAAKVRLAGLRFNTSLALPPADFMGLCGLGAREDVGIRWGHDMQTQCILFETARAYLEQNGTILESSLANFITEKAEKIGVDNIKIWCHWREKEQYQSLLSSNGIELEDKNFLCSIADYRGTSIFGTLVRVGPLREFGWSRLPSILLSAPRYHELAQFVWEGIGDSEHIGQDPFISNIDYRSLFFETVVEEVISQDELSAEDVSDTHEIIDDFVFFNEHRYELPESVPCWLVELASDSGLLLGPGSSQLVFDSTERKSAVAVRRAADLKQGQYLVIHYIHADFGPASSRTPRGLAGAWKSALRRMWRQDESGLLSRMRAAGIKLRTLDGAVRHWMSEEGVTIRAPQSRDNFKRLIERVLPPDCLGNKTWKHAWQEIRRSRAEAIKDGTAAVGLVTDELVDGLNKRSDLQNSAKDMDYFEIALDPSGGLEGILQFFLIERISRDFRAPREKLGVPGAANDYQIYRSEHNSR